MQFIVIIIKAPEVLRVQQSCAFQRDFEPKQLIVIDLERLMNYNCAFLDSKLHYKSTKIP